MFVPKVLLIAPIAIKIRANTPPNPNRIGAGPPLNTFAAMKAAMTAMTINLIGIV